MYCPEIILTVLASAHVRRVQQINTLISWLSKTNCFLKLELIKLGLLSTDFTIFGNVRNLLWKQNHTLQVYSSIVKSVFPYGAECWRHVKTETNQTKKNMQSVLAKIKCECIEVEVKNKRWRWLGYRHSYLMTWHTQDMYTIMHTKSHEKRLKDNCFKFENF